MGKPCHIVFGLHFGDEGKGTIVDALVRKTGASTVVRFNGGGQAAHNVVDPDGRHHTFSQWGSGTLAGARTILTRDFLLSPMAMPPEAEHLRSIGISKPFDLVTVDERALLVTPFHGALNRIKELARGADAHGTCGMGIGEAVSDSVDGRIEEAALLRARDLRDPDALDWKIRSVQADKFAAALRVLAGRDPEFVAKELGLLQGSSFADTVINLFGAAGKLVRVASDDEIASLLREGDAVFEGAQGVLLDEWHGFFPHTTWSTTTPDNARLELELADFEGDVQTIGVTRAYFTRHGAGPFPSQTKEPWELPGEHNGASGWQGTFRVGGFDAVLAKYAVDAAGRIDALAVTCCDHQKTMRLPTVVAYRHEVTDGKPVVRMRASHDPKPTLRVQQTRGELLNGVETIVEPSWDAERIAGELKIPLLVKSHGPKSDQKEWL